MNASTLVLWLQRAAAALHEEADSLRKFDADIGDADHGANMERGFAAVAERLESLETTSPREVLLTAGSTLVSTVGGASGPLWGTALRHAGRVLGDAEEFEALDLAEALDAALAAIVELGGAQVGDKTMVDALAPAVKTLRVRVESGDSPREAAAAARAAAESGAKSTIDLQARKGRASYVGERSIGHQDPGAASTVIIFRALERTLPSQ
jgi:dihydroxyacetone kinase-like protein